GWCLISCIWLHAGVFHVSANMLGFLVIEVRMEREFGFVKIVLLYVMVELDESVISGHFVCSNISVGASGVVFRLLDAKLSKLIINCTIYSNKVASLLMLILIVVVNLGVGILPHVDNFGHIGGFPAGFFLARGICHQAIYLIQGGQNTRYISEWMGMIIVLGVIIEVVFLHQNRAIV
ncbi:RHOMBOID-like protein 1, partial [Bienertia sinuspersici]